MRSSIQLAIVGGLAALAALGACVHQDEAPPSEPPAPPSLAERLALQAPPGTYFEEWPDIYVDQPSREAGDGVKRPPDGARDRFLPGYPAPPPSGPESQRPLRTLEKPR